ncbi:hypothetical protein ACMXYQ_12720 [Neptuniibacter sp. PT34_22]|uniref:hypothetical protein n=1 Tax=Neptuniibacter sp. PT34_22 TaxID=3398205 RepID=UPI0039F47B02
MNMDIEEFGTEIYRLGRKLSDLDFSGIDIHNTEDRGVLKVHLSKDIWFFEDTRTGELDQLTFMNGYTGKVLGAIGIGDAISLVFERFGKCSKSHRVYEPYNFPWLAFETEGGSKSRESVITHISVSIPFKFYGPAH